MLGYLILVGLLYLLAKRYWNSFKREAWGLDDFRKSGFVEKDFMAVRKLKRNYILVILSETVRPDAKLLLQHLCPTQLRKTVFLCNVDDSAEPTAQLPHKWKSPVEFYVSTSPETDIVKYTEPTDELVFASDTDKIFNGVIELYDYTMDHFAGDSFAKDRIYTVKASKEYGLYTWSIRQSICVSRKQLDFVLDELGSMKIPMNMLSWEASWTFLWNQFVWTSLQAMSVLVTETSEVYEPPWEPITHKTAQFKELTHKESEVIWSHLEQCPQ